jgi:methylated-DNA-[protein]-cysteine S-methyltransferase
MRPDPSELPADSGMCLFPTALGACGVAWEAGAIVATQLPEASEEATLRRLATRCGSPAAAAPPAFVGDVIEAVARLLAGERVDLAFAPLALDRVEAFAAQVYALARAIPPGRVRSYGDLARELGDVALSQAVGAALGRNPWPIVVPCHRVLGAARKLTGFSAHGGVETKLRMLAIEGALLDEEPGLFGRLPLAARPRR